MASYQYIYVMRRLTKIFPGGKKVLEDITLAFLPGAKIGVLGVNGAGKSTLLRIMAGLDQDFSGEAWAAEGARVGFLPQEPELDPAKDVLGNVMEGVAATKALLDRFDEVSAKFGDPDADMDALMAEQAELQEKIDAVQRLGAAAHARDRDGRAALPAGRSGREPRSRAASGAASRCAGCCCSSPTCCCSTSRPTISMPNRSPGSSASCRSTRAPWSRSPTTATSSTTSPAGSWSSTAATASRGRATTRSWLEQKQKRLAQEERQEDARQRTLERELEWIRQSPRARQAKSKARITAYEDLLSQAQDRAPGSAQIMIPPGPRLGDLVIEAEHLRKGYGDRLLIEDLDFRLPPGGIVGVIGPNGAGKTTLFRMITGQEKPDGGALRVGDTVKLGYVDQSRDALAANKTVWEEISGGHDTIQLGKREVNSRAYVAAFNFRGPDQQKKVGQLSGGERNRVHLAKLLKGGANVILLDEPTNDLDVDTLRALEDALLDFAGCAVVISHDRWFLDRIATHILAFEGDSRVEWFEGNYQDYEADRNRRLGAEADQPHRIKYKPLKVA